MEKYIKYKRISTTIKNDSIDEELQNFFDNIIKDGFEIISYKEESVIEFEKDTNVINSQPILIPSTKIIVIVGKRQENNITKLFI